VTTFSRRAVLASFVSSLALSSAMPALAQAVAQGAGAASFNYDDVVRRARELAGMAHHASTPALPDTLQKLDFDSYRDIRFKPERALLGQNNSRFRMHLFHPGFLFNRPVIVNILREGVATPVPYQAQSFDYGRNKFDKNLPVNMGFAGFRLHYPLNSPKIFDELISFLGASYFRVLGRDQQYGLSARGLAINAGLGNEEFPFFREFWIEQPGANSERVVIYALLDSPSVTGAYQFIVYPADNSVVDVTLTLFPRQSLTKLGLAPLTSMFFTGENDRRLFDDFRSELHDSDGLLLHSGSGEWTWRPLRNPKETTTSAFAETDMRGFGLMQRDRDFEHYQDVELSYETRPSYWITPREPWGAGHVELIEIPTTDETNDNIVAQWVPKVPLELGQSYVFRYTLTAMMHQDKLHSGGRVMNTYQTKPKALGSNEAIIAGSRRFMIDFVGGDLSYHLKDPDTVQIVASVSQGRILRAFVTPHPRIEGFRAVMDVAGEPGQSIDIRGFLRASDKALTETWTYLWRVE
jgi:periplasmic glucans biosynthesis protein